MSAKTRLVSGGGKIVEAERFNPEVEAADLKGGTRLLSKGDAGGQRSRQHTAESSTRNVHAMLPSHSSSTAGPLRRGIIHRRIEFDARTRLRDPRRSLSECRLQFITLRKYAA